MSPERRLDAHDAQWTVQAMARGALTIGAVLGVLIIVGGAERWSGPAYATALTYPHAPESWGWVIGAASVAGLLGSLLSRLLIVSATLFVIAVWSLFFSWSILQAAVDNSHSGTTGIPVYFGFAVACILLGEVHRRSAARDALHR